MGSLSPYAWSKGLDPVEWGIPTLLPVDSGVLEVLAHAQVGSGRSPAGTLVLQGLQPILSNNGAALSRAWTWPPPGIWAGWRREEKGTTEDEVAGWHNQLNGHEFG